MEQKYSFCHFVVYVDDILLIYNGENAIAVAEVLTHSWNHFEIGLTKKIDKTLEFTSKAVGIVKLHYVPMVRRLLTYFKMFMGKFPSRPPQLDWT